MRDLDESLAGLAAYALRGRIGRDQRWMPGLEVLQLPHQFVEFGVADLGLIEDVVAVFVVADFVAEGCDLLFDVFRGGHRRRL